MAELNPFFPQGIPPPVTRKVSTRAPAQKIAPQETAQKTNDDWFWGISHSMQKLKHEFDLASTQDLTVLLIGETGTGKEFFAGSLHRRSTERRGLNPIEAPFTPVNMGAVPEDLAESLLFGHERGAFTSARERQHGKFELARKGTLFLDEIQSASPAVQIKILRALQSKSFERLGSKLSQPVECRIVAATNIPLELLVQRNRFRKDLYYRLNICPLYIPALRNRKQDLPFLVKGLLAKIARDFNCYVTDVSEDTYDIFLSYAWPGNVRELEHTLLYAGLRAKGTILPEHLPDHLTGRLQDYLSEGDWSL